MNNDMKKTVDILRFCSGDGECEECVLRDYDGCMAKVRMDAADLIERLSEELERVSLERDAAVQDLILNANCTVCNNYAVCNNYVKCAEWMATRREGFIDAGNASQFFEWRGVCEENSGGTV